MHFHVLNKIIGGENVFEDEKIAQRIKLVLELANSHYSARAFNLLRTYAERGDEGQALLKAKEIAKRGETFVDILEYSIMKNHYHILLSSESNKALGKFMQRFGTAITMYVNALKERQGHLFQGKYKAIGIKSDEQLMVLSVYIHLNALDYFMPHWREGGLSKKEWNSAVKYLKSYIYHSLPGFLELRDDPILAKDALSIIKDRFSDNAEYINFMAQYACGYERGYSVLDLE